MSIASKIVVTLVSLILISSYGEFRFYLDAWNRTRLMKCWLAGVVVMWVWL